MHVVTLDSPLHSVAGNIALVDVVPNNVLWHEIGALGELNFSTYLIALSSLPKDKRDMDRILDSIG